MGKSEIKDLINSCGNIINISEHATMMVPFYYLPLLVLILLLAKGPFVKVFRSVLIWQDLHNVHISYKSFV